jgi:hypothetical protein
MKTSTFVGKLLVYIIKGFILCQLNAIFAGFKIKYMQKRKSTESAIITDYCAIGCARELKWIRKGEVYRRNWQRTEHYC